MFLQPAARAIHPLSGRIPALPSMRGEEDLNVPSDVLVSAGTPSRISLS